MPEFERLGEAITWIDLSFVERQRTPSWAIYEAIQCHIAGMSLRDVSTHLEKWGSNRCHVAVHNWVHAADLQPTSTVTTIQLAVDEKTIRINGHDHWLYAAVDPPTNQFLHARLFPTTVKQTTRGFWPICTAAISLMASRSSSTTPTISSRFSAPNEPLNLSASINAL